ncbi:hypothetical protein ANN_06155, partial [Periplaneta americana]
MAGLYEGDNEPAGSLKAICKYPTSKTQLGLLASRMLYPSYSLAVGVRACWERKHTSSARVTHDRWFLRTEFS